MQLVELLNEPALEPVHDLQESGPLAYTPIAPRRANCMLLSAHLDVGPAPQDNSGMEISGHVQNGVIVIDGSASLHEGAAVTVTLQAEPAIRVAKNPRRIEFPLVPSSAPGSAGLTNAMINELLDQEDASS